MDPSSNTPRLHPDRRRAVDFSRYAVLRTTPGAPWFSLAGWLGRFPRSAVSLAIILLVASRTGSYALAGLVSAAFIVAMAVAGPWWSRRMDRLGQPRVLRFSYLATAGATALLVAVAWWDLARPWWFAAAALLGASMCDVSSAVRARWTHLIAPGHRDTPYAVEAMADETVFIVAPPLVTLVAAASDPALGLVLAVLIGGAGALWLAVQHDSAPPPQAPAQHGVLPLPPARLLPIIAAMVGIGAMFGSFDVTAVGWGEELDRPWLTGAIMATMAVGNAAGSLLFGAMHWQWGLRRRFLVAAAVLAATSVTLPLAPGIGGAFAAVFLVGVAVGPVMVSSVALLGSRSDPARVTEMLSWQGLGLSAGVPLGGTIAGRAMDVSGASSAFIVMAVSAASVIVVAGLGEALLSRAGTHWSGTHRVGLHREGRVAGGQPASDRVTEPLGERFE